VTGTSSGSETSDDYATIKYYPNGDTAWVRRYNGPANWDDEVSAIAVDDSGNIYVTGGSVGSGTNMDYATIKYRPDGDTVWVRRYNGAGSSYDRACAIALDGSNNVYVTGGGAEDYTTIRYYPNGDTAWVRRYDGAGSGDGARAMAIDNLGNIYVTGVSWGSGTNQDYATIKYDVAGNELWVARYDAVNYPDEAYAMAVDGSDNIYVTGYSYGSETGRDYATIKYYPNGDTAWVRRYDGPASNDDRAFAIAVNGSNNVFVTGISDVSAAYYNTTTTIKYYYPNGDTAWVRGYIEPSASGYAVNAIAVDGSGNVYVTGASIGYDYVTIKYSPDGDTTWVRRYNGPGNHEDHAEAIAVDGSGNVYVTGRSRGIGTDYDYTTIKYVQFLCGDVNKDGAVSSADVVYLINYLFIGGPAPVPILHVGDVNQDEVVNSADVVYLINYLFIGGPAPCS
jgi:hypothetical protein